MSYQDDLTPKPKLDGGEGGPSNVCRDYLRNVCKRGAYCRYWHPAPDVGVDVVFCHDFQNAGCRRVGCRFVHCTREEEELYRRTGQLPLMVTPNMARSSLASACVSNASDVPVCKDYLKGECRRGVKCKYEHLEESSGSEVSDTVPSYSSTLSTKVRKTEPAEGEVELVTLADYRAVEEENRALRNDVDELRRTVGVLVATNEMLLEQNAKYRSTVSAASSPVVATPAVIASSSAVAALSHITIEGGSGLVVAQPTPTAASVAVATLRPCVTATATLHPVMTATPRLHPIATATLHPVGTATLRQNSAATLHSVVPGSIVSASAVAVEPSPGSVAIGVPSHAIVPVTLTVAAMPTAPVAPVASSSQLQSASTYVNYPIMSNGTHVV